MDPRLLGDREELLEAFEGLRIGLVRTGQDARHLGMNPNGGGARGFHLGEVSFDAG